MRDVYLMIVLSLTFSGCTILPKMPETPIGLYDNYSKTKDGKRDYSKSPVFHMVGSNGIEFEIPWNSESAKNMVCTPHKNYEELNAWLKKVFYVLEKEFRSRR